MSAFCADCGPTGRATPAPGGPTMSFDHIIAGSDPSAVAAGPAGFGQILDAAALSLLISAVVYFLTKKK